LLSLDVPQHLDLAHRLVDLNELRRAGSRMALNLSPLAQR